MIALRSAALAPDVEYFVDCAQEAGELDACSAMAVRLYGDDEAVKFIIDHPCAGFRERRAKCMDVAALADSILTKLELRRAAGLVNCGLKHLVYELHGMAECIAGWAIEDEIDGGCLEPFRAEPRCTKGVTWRRTDRRLRSPQFIRRYVRRVGIPEACTHLADLTRMQIARARRYGVEHDPTVMGDFQRQLNHRRVELRRHAELREFLPPTRRERRAERKMIRRSLNTAVATIGEASVRSFLRGEEIRLLGSELILSLRKRGSLADRGHNCLSVGMLSSDGTQLADLCICIEGTPTLDQLTGFALCMSSGGEEEVLQTANITTLSAAGRMHPIMVKRRSDQAAAAVDELARLIGPEGAERARALMAGERNGVQRQLDHEARRERNKAYWEATQGEWIEAMVAIVIGYRNLPLFKAAGAL